MIQTIAGTARIATKIIKNGSVAGRDAFCQKLENQLFTSLEKYQHTQFDYIEKNIRKFLPDKYIWVEKLPKSKKKYGGSVMLAREKERTIPADIIGYILTYKTGAPKEHFGGVRIEVLMHEIHHLFNYFTHPKVPNRIYKVSKIPSEKNFERFFVEHFQSPMPPHKCKTQTEKLLENQKDYKIDILQYLRYKLIDEIGAYETGEMYRDLYHLKHIHKPRPAIDSHIQTMCLHSKLADITAMLKQALKNERSAISKTAHSV